MKHSNKVLTTTLLLSAVVIFIIPASVNIQYANGHNTIDTTHVYRTLHPVKTILIKGISNCWIVPSDSFRVASSKKYINEVLTINLKDTLSLALKESEHSDSTEVILYVPIDKVDLIISYSNTIRLMGQIRLNELPSYHFELHNSTVSLAPSRLRQSFNRLELDGENSSLIVQEFNHINELRVNNINKISISPRSDIDNIKTTFVSRSNVQIIKSIAGTEISSNQ